MPPVTRYRSRNNTAGNGVPNGDFTSIHLPSAKNPMRIVEKSKASKHSNSPKKNSEHNSIKMVTRSRGPAAEVKRKTTRRKLLVEYPLPNPGIHTLTQPMLKESQSVIPRAGSPHSPCRIDSNIIINEVMGILLSHNVKESIKNSVKAVLSGSVISEKELSSSATQTTLRSSEDIGTTSDMNNLESDASPEELGDVGSESQVDKIAIRQPSSVLQKDVQDRNQSVRDRGTLPVGHQFSRSATEGDTTGQSPGQPPAGQTRHTALSPDGPRSPRSGQEYTYLELASLRNNDIENQRVNVYGVVSTYIPPHKTRGTDWVLHVNLTDPSIYPDEFQVTVFQQELALPAVKSVGDVVRFHRIKVTSYHNRRNAQSTHGFSSLVFHKECTAYDAPIANTASYTWTAQDRRRAVVLRNWGRRHLTSVGTCTKMISQVRQNQYVDLLCQLIGWKELNHNKIMIRVWDGTELPSLCQVYGCLSVRDDDLDDSLPGNKCIDILVYDRHCDTVRGLQPRQFIKITNLHVDHGRRDPDDYAFILHGGNSHGRGISILVDDSEEHQLLQSQLQNEQNINSPV